MRLFIAIANSGLAAQVRAAIESFGDIEIDGEQGLLALEKVRRTEIDGLLVALDPSVPEHDQLLTQVTTELPDLPVVVIGHDAKLGKLRELKVKARPFALLRQPIEPVELFRTLRRLRERRLGPQRALVH